MPATEREGVARERGFFNRCYDWMLACAGGRHAERVLAMVAFAESSFFPLPPDIMLVPMVLARPERAWRIAAIATCASVIGGLFGYAIGDFLLATIGQWIITLYHLQNGLERFQQEFARWGVWVILLKGLTPIPFKLVTIASGIAHFPLPAFVLASIATRGGRFFLLALLIRKFGPPVQIFIERFLPWVLLSVAATCALGYWIFFKLL